MPSTPEPTPSPSVLNDFVREKVRSETAAGKYGSRVATRFPPEPNGYLHIGHAKSICLNFGIADEMRGAEVEGQRVEAVCHLRMDDTNPAAEDPEYVAAIQNDVRWLGFEWGENMFYASDYYGRIYELAEKLIARGLAYVCHLSEEEISLGRGAVGEPGKDSPYRIRSVEENLTLFRKMKDGAFKEGECVLRAKIDMASPNMKMRDPAIYRIKRAHHYRTGDEWCIYPLYDFAHCLSDSFERITHSICTTEFESARELYDWVIEATEVPWVPRQTEFARLNLSYTVMSKRRLLDLVKEGHVRGWDDPRMPTIAGLRRRGVTPEAIRDFCHRIGVSKNLSVVDLGFFEHVIREDLNHRAPRVLAVLKPLKLVIDNLAESHADSFEAPYWPHDIQDEAHAGSRVLPFSRELYIERDDFMADPPKDFHRLAIGKSVRLRHAFVVTATHVERGAAGEIVAVHATVDEDTRGGNAGVGKKVPGTIEWVSAGHAVDAEVRLYDRLFGAEEPGAGGRDFKADLLPHSCVIVTAKVEPSLAAAKAGERFQFERAGFFVVDPDSARGKLVFNRTVLLKDSYGKHVAATPPKPAAAQKAYVEGVAEISDAERAFAGAHRIPADQARTILRDAALAELFSEGFAAGATPGPLAALLTNEVLRELGHRKLLLLPFGGADLAALLELTKEGILTSKLARDVLVAMFDGEGGPRVIVEKRGLRQVTDEGAIGRSIDEVLAANADVVARYKGGNANVFGALVGLCVKRTGGRANPKLVTELLKARLA